MFWPFFGLAFALAFAFATPFKFLLDIILNRSRRRLVEFLCSLSLRTTAASLTIRDTYEILHFNIASDFQHVLGKRALVVTN